MNKLQYILICSLLMLCACNKEIAIADQTEYAFTISNNDAFLPVLVKGNTQSKVFCITLHGGPGDSGIQSFGYTDVFNLIEKDFAMVHFDQRCAGISQGNCDAEKLEVADFEDDIDKLVEVLQELYGADISIFLLSHSWGATLGLSYLINGKHKSKISGFIQSNGSHNIPMLSIEHRKFLRHHANQQISYDNNKSEWERILNIVETSDSNSINGIIDVLTETYNTRVLFEDVDSISIPSNKPNNFHLHMSNSLLANSNSSANDNETWYKKLLKLDMSDELANISNPVGLFWGKYDAVHPPAMVYDIYDLIGSTEKELHFFERSFHAPMAHENALYQEKVIDFIYQYK